MPQLGGFGFELGTWLEAEASAGWVGGADSGGLCVLGVWLSSLGAEVSFGSESLDLEVVAAGCFL